MTIDPKVAQALAAAISKLVEQAVAEQLPTMLAVALSERDRVTAERVPKDGLRVLSLASDLTAGDFGGYQAVLAIHAEGSIEAEKLTILAQYDRAAATEYASWLAGLSDDRWPPRAPDAY